MKTRNKLLTLLLLTTGATASIALINKAIKMSATSKNLLEENQSLCYKWRLGNIHYTKTGTGKPLLLIHDLNHASSSYEWSKVTNQLKEQYTVYTLDLLGCGRSEKPNMVYTNYLYVQMISDFIKSEIGHRTNVIATGESGSFTIMACNNNPELFDQIMLVNPLSLSEYSQIPGKYARLLKLMIEIPIVGTLLYHISCTKQAITEDFVENYFYNPYAVHSTDIDAYHEAAHLGASPKSVYASVKCKYAKCNITNALKKIDNSIYLIGGEGLANITEQLEEFKQYNPAIEVTAIPETKRLPQLESPSRFVSAIATYFG